MGAGWSLEERCITIACVCTVGLVCSPVGATPRSFAVCMRLVAGGRACAEHMPICTRGRQRMREVCDGGGD